ncbi:HAD-IIIA family hydrolase [Lichenicola sp.]|uniref:HAD-IIIA family hydrolase n=1 Tax=Lichenicola sp. TaxID=2804529 RepID=UPI003B000CB4
MVRQCAILVGGLGTRLGALTQALPKPLMPCGDRPFLAWLMREMQRFGFDDFVLLAGHMSDEIENAVEQIRARLPKPARITVSVEPFRAGTGGALHHARALLDERFVLCNGDSIFACNLARFLAHATRDASFPNWILLRAVDDLDRYGAVSLDEGSDRVTSFQARSDAGSAGLINSGIYLLDHSVFDHVSESCSLEQDVLPRLAGGGELGGLVLDGYFRDIGLPGDLAAAGEELPRQLVRPAVFLDRDGVINVDHGWVGTRDRFEWADGVFPALQRLTDRGYHVFIVTNQSGVARGHYSEDDLDSLMRWAIGTIRANGATIDDWRYCPTHPSAPLERYRSESPRRKPGTGMIDELVAAWEIDRTQSFLFGDQPSDITAGQAAGLQTSLVQEQTLAEIVFGRSAFA